MVFGDLVPRGYSVREVHDLIDRAAAALDSWESGQEASFTADKLEQSSVHIDIRGYPKDEVEVFITAVARSLRHHETEHVDPRNLRPGNV